LGIGNWELGIGNWEFNFVIQNNKFINYLPFFINHSS